MRFGSRYFTIEWIVCGVMVFECCQQSLLSSYVVNRRSHAEDMAEEIEESLYEMKFPYKTTVITFHVYVFTIRVDPYL